MTAAYITQPRPNKASFIFLLGFSLMISSLHFTLIFSVLFPSLDLRFLSRLICVAVHMKRFAKMIGDRVTTGTIWRDQCSTSPKVEVAAKHKSKQCKGGSEARGEAQTAV